METLRLSTKGQIVIPKSIRGRHRWEPGTEFTIEEEGDSLVLRPLRPFPPTSPEAGLGCTGYRGPAKSLEEMEEGISKEARRRWKNAE